MFMPATPAEERLEQLLQAPDFAPPTEFAAQAKVADAAVYEQAAADPQAWWAGQARQRLDWDTPFATALDDSNPPFYRWFADGTLNPANLAGIEAVRALLPDLPQVAVFDTAFHQTMPPHAYRYAVPEEWYTRHGVRRFGFHGISPTPET